MCRDLLDLLLKVASRFLKPDCLNTINSCPKILSFDLRETANHQKTILGFSAKKMLSDPTIRRKFSETDLLGLRLNAKQICIRFCTKLQNKSPLNYPMVINLACLDPKYMIEHAATSRA